MAARLSVHPVFYRRVEHYRDRIARHDGRPQVAVKFTEAVERGILRLVENPFLGHSARFESTELQDILRASVLGFPIFAIFYRWNGKEVIVITVEHTAQDLPARVAGILS